MKDEFKIPKPIQRPAPPQPFIPGPSTPTNHPPTSPMPMQSSQKSQSSFKRQKLHNKLFWAVLSIILSVIIILGILMGLWYSAQLQPREVSAAQKRVFVQPGSTLIELSEHLEKEGIIKNAFVFQLYMRLNGYQSRVQAGSYVLSPSQSVADIAAYLVKGKVDALRITLVPGQTLPEIRAALEQYGYASHEIDEALSRTYSHPLLASKPSNADLEGYIYPETYELSGDGDVSRLFIQSFDAFYEQIKASNIEQKLVEKKLSLHQAITLSSIIQKEVSDPDDQRRVAQVFLKRLSEGIQLGSDVTFIYGAKKLGVPPSVNLDSPYNTRKYPGLPPGPISNFNLSALQSVADPAPGDYLYFVADVKGVTYFSRTLDEHEENVRRHCTAHCDEF